MARTKTMSVAEFMAKGGPRPCRKYDVVAQVGAGTGAMLAGNRAVAADTEGVIMGAFDPLIDMIKSLSYPIAGVMITGAALMLMLNQKERGYSWMFNAAIGYVIVQMSPILLKILVEVGNKVADEV